MKEDLGAAAAVTSFEASASCQVVQLNASLPVNTSNFPLLGVLTHRCRGLKGKVNHIPPAPRCAPHRGLTIKTPLPGLGGCFVINVIHALERRSSLKIEHQISNSLYRTAQIFLQLPLPGLENSLSLYCLEANRVRARDLAFAAVVYVWDAALECAFAS